MNIFYAPQIDEDKAFLDAGESRHCIRVLRMKSGDDIQFIDGRGNFYQGKLIKADENSCEILILGKHENFEQRPYYLHIAIAPTKNTDRFEWFLEKATEIGVDKITPIICEHSERRKIRMDRFEKVILSAVKQSVKAKLPELGSLTFLDEFLENGNHQKEKYIAHCMNSNRHELLKMADKSASYLILIGPEGDFSQSEITLAQTKSFIPVSLGTSRLRTETAGIVAAQIISDAININK